MSRKNSWQIAEQARQARPYGIQRLLSAAVWDQDAVRDELRTLIRQTLLPLDSPQEVPFPVLVLDESGFPKHGHRSAASGPSSANAPDRLKTVRWASFSPT